MVCGQPLFPSDSAGLRAALGHRGGRGYSAIAGAGNGNVAGPSPVENPNAGLRKRTAGRIAGPPIDGRRRCRATGKWPIAQLATPYADGDRTPGRQSRDGQPPVQPVSTSPNRQAKTAGAANSGTERTILVGPGRCRTSPGQRQLAIHGRRTGFTSWFAARLARSERPDSAAAVVRPPECHPSDEPVLRHTRTYHGTDPEFTAALRTYATFRDDARFGGWASYLQRSDDFIRFCCHKHIAEMLTARGGAGETRVLLRWSEGRYIP